MGGGNGNGGILCSCDYSLGKAMRKHMQTDGNRKNTAPVTWMKAWESWMRWAKREPWIRRRPWPCIRQAATQTDASAWTVTSSQVRRCTNYCSPAACATYTEHASAVADGPARRSVSAKILSAASELRDNTSQLTQTIARHLLVRCSVLYHRRTCSKHSYLGVRSYLLCAFREV